MKKMNEIKINISEFKSEGSDVKKELVEFLKEKTKAEVDAGTSDIIIKGEGKTVSKGYVRVLLRKFLHKKELKDNFRVIVEKENTLKVKEKKTAEEEE
jgi:hypothetical protein